VIVRGKITSGWARMSRRRRRAAAAHGSDSGNASTSGSTPSDSALRPLRGAWRHAGAWSTKPASISAALEGTQLHVAGRLAQLDDDARDARRGKPRSQFGSGPKPTVEMKPSRMRPASPVAALRASAGSAAAWRSRRAPGSTSTSPAGVSATLRRVRSNNCDIQAPFELLDRERQRRLRHVQRRRGPAESAAARPGQGTGASCAVRSADHSFAKHINLMPTDILDAHEAAARILCTFPRQIEGDDREDQPPLGQHHRRRRARAEPLDVLRARLREADFKKPMIGVANGHSTITPCNSGCSAWPMRPSPASSGRRQRADLRHPDHQRRHGDGHRRA
jgi:hypothetical protein